MAYNKLQYQIKIVEYKLESFNFIDFRIIECIIF
jgi:hypothetical protein